ncbi:MAG: small-conductance mechanosensitive channel [Candidatus Omnitrophota bacterium]|jgi:small-conductance mechanosensitive channel
MLKAISKDKASFWRFNLNQHMRAIICITLIAIICPISANQIFAAEIDDISESLVIEKPEDVAKSKIAQKKEVLQEAVEEVEKAIAATQVINEEVKLKEREVIIVQEEAALLKEQALRTPRDANIAKQIVEADQQVKSIEEETLAAKKKLALTESKTLLAQERIARDQKEIDTLKKELNEIRLQSVGLGGVAKWINKPLFYISGSPVTLGGIISAILIIFAALFISALIQRIIRSKLSKTSRLKSGVIYAIGRVAHYLVVILAAIIAAQCIGINLGSFTVVFGFLSVGIGFGLQNITSNFISGLILLFERPIAVGDFVTVDGQRGTVKQINMRSSLISTLDSVSIIVPNSKFIEGKVTNWTHGSPKVRIHCPVGVSYGSDIAKVKEALFEVATQHKSVLNKPLPDVRFIGFGDSSLDFDLLIWINEPEKQEPIRSDINYAIDAAFRQTGIEIPFPQRDLHIKSSNVSFEGK